MYFLNLGPRSLVHNASSSSPTCQINKTSLIMLDNWCNTVKNHQNPKKNQPKKSTPQRKCHSCKLVNQDIKVQMKKTNIAVSTVLLKKQPDLLISITGKEEDTNTIFVTSKSQKHKNFWLELRTAGRHNKTQLIWALQNQTSESRLNRKPFFYYNYYYICYFHCSLRIFWSSIYDFKQYF